MPIIFILCALTVGGVISSRERPQGKTYHHNDMDSMLKEMTGKTRAENRRILRKYGRK